MCERRSSTSTRLSSSVAARSATVSPKKPDPTTTRSYPAKLTGTEGSSAGSRHPGQPADARAGSVVRPIVTRPHAE